MVLFRIQITIPTNRHEHYHDNSKEKAGLLKYGNYVQRGDILCVIGLDVKTTAAWKHQPQSKPSQKFLRV
jgi:hypothetical protein